jgi:hypothetical protein
MTEHTLESALATYRQTGTEADRNQAISAMPSLCTRTTVSIAFHGFRTTYGGISCCGCTHGLAASSTASIPSERLS